MHTLTQTHTVMAKNISTLGKYDQRRLWKCIFMDSQSQSPATTIIRSQSPEFWSPVPAAINQDSFKYTLHSDTHRPVYPEQFPDPVCTYLYILTFSDSQRSSSVSPLFLIPALCWSCKGKTLIRIQLRPIELTYSPRFSPVIYSSCHLKFSQ